MNFIGGKIKSIAPRVMTPNVFDTNQKLPKRTKLEKVIDEAFNERDRLIGGLLDLDDKFDAVENAIQDQIKNMDIPVTNRSVRQAVRELGGDNAITADIFNKARKIAEAIPTIMGLNPLHVPFAKKTDKGKALTQYSGDILRKCSDIDWKNFPNKKIYDKSNENNTPFIPSKSSSLDDEGIGNAGKNEDDSLLTTLENLIDKAKVDIKNYIIYKLFWDLIYRKFLLSIALWPYRNLANALKPWITKKIIGKPFKMLYCIIVKIIKFYESIPGIFGLRAPPISGEKIVTSHVTEENSDEQKSDVSPLSRPLQNVGINETIQELNDCGEVTDKPSDIINKNDTIEEKKTKITNNVHKCTDSVTFGGETAPIVGLETTEKVTPDNCYKGKIRLMIEDIAATAGTGINENVPAQEGFIPPPCFEHAKTIIEAVKNDALFGNTDNKYNSTAILFSDLAGGSLLRDYHELSKFMITIQDNSEGSKALRANTAKKTKYNQIYLNKDVEDFRNKIINKDK